MIHPASASGVRSAVLQARTAIFGGTFDPVHNAHLAMARAALDEFLLQRILFVPAANPPHKSGVFIAPWDDRVHMLELACAGQAGFEVSLIERDANPSYSISTMERLLSADSSPLAFLIGADAFAEIRTWHRWEDVLKLVEFIVVTRPGFVYDVPDGARVHEITDLELPVSSSEVREEIARGAADIAVPESVLTYIRERGLYAREQTAKAPTL